MISLSMVVSIIIYLLIAAGVFGLLYFLVHFIASRPGVQGPAATLFVSVADIVLVVAAVLILIGILLQFAGVKILS